MANSKDGAPAGAGIIEHRGPKTWRIRFFLGTDPETGKPMLSPSRTVHGTKTQAREEAERYRQELILAARKADSGGEATVGDYLAVWSARRQASPEIKSSTIARERPALSRIKHYFGDMPLSDLTVKTVKEVCTKAKTEDGVSDNAIHYMRQKLRQVLDEAEADGLIAANPAANRTIRTPATIRTPRKSLTKQRAIKLRHIDVPFEEKSRYMGVVIGLVTGCRRGEVLGLQWKHVHLGEDPYISIEQQLVKKHRGYEPPKAGSYRKIALDPETAKTLATWKKDQAKYLQMTAAERSKLRRRRDAAKRDRPAASGDKQHSKGYDLLQTEETAVVCDSFGEPHNTDNYSRWFRDLCCREGFGAMCDEKGNPVARRVNERGFPVDENGRPYSRSNPNPRPRLHYEGLKFHELRHTNISLLVAAGVDPKAVQQRAGHKRLSTTVDVYAHAMPEGNRKAAGVIGDLLGV